MPSHDQQPPADPARRARLLAGLGLLAAGLPMTGEAATPALPAPPAGAQAVDWDHFGEPSLSAARRANVTVSRALQATAVDTRLYRLPADVQWEAVLGHYQQAAKPAWKLAASAGRVETGNPAWQQRFSAAGDAGHGFAVVWLPATGGVRDGLLMVLSTAPSR
jgi:hypothetical protein